MSDLNRKPPQTLSSSGQGLFFGALPAAGLGLAAKFHFLPSGTLITLLTVAFALVVVGVVFKAVRASRSHGNQQQAC